MGYRAPSEEDFKALSTDPYYAYFLLPSGNSGYLITIIKGTLGALVPLRRDYLPNPCCWFEASIRVVKR